MAEANFLHGDVSNADSFSAEQEPDVVYQEYGKNCKDPTSLWYYFLREVNGQSAKCKSCKKTKILKTLGGSTKGLHGHLRGVHKIDVLNKSATIPSPNDFTSCSSDERLNSSGKREASASQNSSNSAKRSKARATKAAKTMGPIAYLTRREHFSAAHRLYSKLLTEEENFSIYSKCANENGHGHNYNVEVTVKGPVDPRTGMVMNITDIKHAMDQGIMMPLDHKNIDKDVPYFENVISTTENLAIFIWRQMIEYLDNPHLLYEVKVWETEKNIVTYRGD